MKKRYCLDYKIRIYRLHGSQKGNLEHEEFFQTKDEAISRYKELTGGTGSPQNPTLWKRNRSCWTRVEGY